MAVNTIICATKGSLSSKIAEDKAIEIAKENNSKLIFLYVIDVGFIEKSGALRDFAKDDVSHGLTNIGSVILDMAKEKAVSKGILPENVLKEEVKGNFISKIKTLVEKHNADIIVIGRPDRKTGFLERHLLSKEKTEIFVKRLKEEIKCEVMIV